MPTTRTITVDPAVGARYISLSDRPVASTEEFQHGGSDLSRHRR